jgi:hypothetical protein
MRSPLTREEAVKNLSEATYGNLAKAEAFVANLEAAGVSFKTPSQIEEEGIEFISSMSSVWSTCHNPIQVIREDLRSAGYTIVEQGR